MYYFVLVFGAVCLDRTLVFCQTHGFSIKPLKVQLLAGEQKATEKGEQKATEKVPCCFQAWKPRDNHNFGVARKNITR